MYSEKTYRFAFKSEIKVRDQYVRAHDEKEAFKRATHLLHTNNWHPRTKIELMEVLPI